MWSLGRPPQPTATFMRPRVAISSAWFTIFWPPHVNRILLWRRTETGRLLTFIVHLSHLFKKCNMWQYAYIRIDIKIMQHYQNVLYSDTWHLTPDTRYLTPDTRDMTPDTWSLREIADCSPVQSALVWHLWPWPRTSDSASNTSPAYMKKKKTFFYVFLEKQAWANIMLDASEWMWMSIWGIASICNYLSLTALN